MKSYSLIFDFFAFYGCLSPLPCGIPKLKVLFIYSSHKSVESKHMPYNSYPGLRVGPEWQALPQASDRHFHPLVFGHRGNGWQWGQWGHEGRASSDCLPLSIALTPLRSLQTRREILDEGAWDNCLVSHSELERVTGWREASSQPAGPRASTLRGLNPSKCSCLSLGRCSKEGGLEFHLYSYCSLWKSLQPEGYQSKPPVWR